MMSSSSSAYGSSFHDNGDGNDIKKFFFTPGKRKSTRDDGDDGNDNGAPNGDQEAKMIPKDRCKTWCGHTAPWHYEQVGPESCSRYYKPTNHPQHAGGLQPTAGAKVPQHRLPRHS
jgi:hypothetical protein